VNRLSAILFLSVVLISCRRQDNTDNDQTDSLNFAREMVRFEESQKEPAFQGTGENTWDQNIRERGFILFENDTYYMWYTGYREMDSATMKLGLATSSDGINWKRYANNPLIDSLWVEDIIVVKSDSVYYMFAEGSGDIAHLLASTDKIHWKELGPLDIRHVDGSPLSKGAYGTPTAWVEDGIWYLLYERGDLGVWLATSSDLKTWTLKQDEPVLIPGPELYDKFGIAVNHVVKYNGLYYAYYHATAFKDWHEWSTCVAASTDLIHWTKFEANPILSENKSSSILVNDGPGYRLYTMHPSVRLHLPAK